MDAPFIFAVMADVVTEFARECVLSELSMPMTALISETIIGLRNKFLKWKEA